MTKSKHLTCLARDGFVLIPSLLTPSQLDALRRASLETVSLARSGQWPYVRTLPKQFPPWTIPPDSSPSAQGIWGVQFLLHPSLPHASTFVANYFSAGMIAIARELLECRDEELVMELFNLLIRPDRDFELRWHRDDIPATATEEEEEERLREPAWHAQWNLALYDDESLVVIPGSHRRTRTEQERCAGPYESGLPGEMRVRMKAGDVVFYDNNILHRGVYEAGRERMTLHGSMGHLAGSRIRARNVLQHGVGNWVERVDLSGLEKQERLRAEGMRERLLLMGRQVDEAELGYSLED